MLLKRSSPVLEINFGSLPTESINLKNHIKFYVYDAFWVPHLFGPPKIPLGPRPWAQRALISMTRRSSTMGIQGQIIAMRKLHFIFKLLFRFQSWPNDPVTHLEPLQLWISKPMEFWKTVLFHANCLHRNGEAFLYILQDSAEWHRNWIHMLIGWSLLCKTFEPLIYVFIYIETLLNRSSQ